MNQALGETWAIFIELQFLVQIIIVSLDHLDTLVSLSGYSYLAFQSGFKVMQQLFFWNQTYKNSMWKLFKSICGHVDYFFMQPL